MNTLEPETAPNASVVIFGAGNIGRSFVAPVFTASGCEAVFADVSPAVLKALETRNSYTLIEKSGTGETSRRIGPVRGIDARDSSAVRRELNAVDVCITCVGAAALPAVLNTIAAAVAERERPFDIVLAENLKSAGALARSALAAAGITRNKIESDIGIVETSIGKMVPIMPSEIAAADPLLCWAEPFNTLIVDRLAFRTTVPEMDSLLAVSPIEPWVARKLYIHNFGHAAAAYLGKQAMPDACYIWEVLENPDVSYGVERAMRASGQALLKEFPGSFTEAEIFDHIGDLIDRFANRVLGDTVYRVGRDLRRKLHRQDRVVGALALALKHKFSPAPFLDVVKAALVFDAANMEGLKDIEDTRIRAVAGTTESFLREIVQVDPVGEPELFSVLESAFG